MSDYAHIQDGRHAERLQRGLEFTASVTHTPIGPTMSVTTTLPRLRSASLRVHGWLWRTGWLPLRIA